MSNIIQFPYQGDDVRFNLDGWINATDIAKHFDKKPVDWLIQRDSVAYLCALAKALGKGDFVQQLNKIKELDGKKASSRAKLLRLSKQTGLIYTKSGAIGGGTWLHPKLAVAFARWVNVEFAVWCDLHIDSILRGHATPQQKYDQACIALTEQNKRGSLAGTELAKHRWHKPPIAREVEYWRQQLEIPLDI